MINEAGNKLDIIIIFWDSWISVAPTIINIANGFEENGHKVFIFIRNVNEVFAPETKLNKNVSVITISKSAGVSNFLKLVNQIPRLRVWINSRFSGKIILYDLVRQSRSILKRKSSQYDCIGVDSMGLIWSASLKKNNTILYYLSLELLCKAAISNKNQFLKWVKKKEILIHKTKVKVTLIQDKFRLSILERENQINLNGNYSIITNSPRDSNSKGHKDTYYFNKKFNLQQEAKKILMAGMVEEVTMSSSIAKTFETFKDKDAKLIFHERQQKNPEDEYFKELKKIGGNNFYLSLNPLPYSEIHKIYDSADIGLVFYDPSYGDNVAYIMGASGKLSHYLKHGLPVISNNLPGFKELFKKYNIGFVLEDINDLETAVNEIFLNYKFYSDNAYKCYISEYNFNQQFEKFYTSNYS